MDIQGEEGKNRVFEFVSKVLVTFAATIIAISATGMIVGHYFEEAREISTLFRLGTEGLPYTVILQLFCWSILITGCSFLLFSDLLFKRMMILWRIALLLLAVFLIGAVFSAVFGWIPVDAWQAWIGFGICTGICFSVSIALMLLKTHLDGKKYEKLLTNYKARHGAGHPADNPKED